MEILGQQPNVDHMTLHWAVDGSTGQDGSSWTGPDFSQDFHTFGLDWEPNALTWYVDGVQHKVFTDASKIPALPMYLLANLAVGGTWPGAPDSTTVFPSYLDIQYIKVWQLAANVTPTPTLNPTLIPPTSTQTPTPIPPTATRTPTVVPPTTTHTLTPVPPTATRTPTHIPPTATPIPPTPTAVIDSSGNTHSGSWAMKVILGSHPTHTSIFQVVNVALNTDYTGNLWVKNKGAIEFYIVAGNGGSAKLAGVRCSGSSWQLCTLPTFNSGNNAQITVILEDDTPKGPADAVFIDDLYLATPGGPNLLANPGLESGPVNWTRSQGDSVFNIVSNP